MFCGSANARYSRTKDAYWLPHSYKDRQTFAVSVYSSSLVSKCCIKKLYKMLFWFSYLVFRLDLMFDLLFLLVSVLAILYSLAISLCELLLFWFCSNSSLLILARKHFGVKPSSGLAVSEFRKNE